MMGYKPTIIIKRARPDYAPGEVWARTCMFSKENGIEIVDEGANSYTYHLGELQHQGPGTDKILHSVSRIRITPLILSVSTLAKRSIQPGHTKLTPFPQPRNQIKKA